MAVDCAKLADMSICWEEHHGNKFTSSVVILGAGPIGLLCCAVALASGASVVVALDVVPARMQFALKYAATATYRMEPLCQKKMSVD